MKKHLLYIIIGAAIGTLPGFLIFIWRVGSTDASWVIDMLGQSLIAGGVPGSICGWIGGAIVKHNRGAVIGGLLGSSFWTLVAATMN